ncbi:MAG: hypothetical protein FJ027_04750 [Candidatus Rokubacteria bacterium]|nr:hypothetical protein [Candidatus Rokubacteria bacterium]
MKRAAVGLALAGMLVMPGMARADASTDAALGLGAFAVFNQILGGTGIFGGGRTVVVERPVVYAPPPPVVYAPPPPPVVYAPRPVYSHGVVYAPARPVVVYPQPVYVAPRVKYHPGHRGHHHGHGHRHYRHHGR